VTDTGLRERKKTETRRTIAEAALRLALEHGPDRVTVEEIAAAADVSPRTVFNHFGTKDEAILGIDADRRTAIVASVNARPAGETPLQALAGVFAHLMTDDDAPGRFWLARAELVRHHPQLRAAQMSSQAALEHDLALAIAARAGLDAEHDAYPALVVTVALTALRVVLARSAHAGPRRLRREIDTAFRQLAGGLVPPARRRAR
jgi:AcrR family transcriptional regulator